MHELLYGLIGFAIGGFVVWLWMHRQQKSAAEMARELFQHAQSEKQQEMEQLLNRIRDAFGSLSMETLKKSTEELLKMADKVLGDQTKMNAEQLDHKKELIDQTLKSMQSELTRVEEIIHKIEKERKQSYGELANQLRESVEQTRRLQQVTNELNTALSNSQVRGQWGERMAEDVLRLAGFIEGINYLKQHAQGESGRPDFTFLLPHNLKVNMDVKFPLKSYLDYLQAESESERNQYKAQFIRDVRKRIKEVTTRDYIDPKSNTVDYVIVFIPNEQVYAFINENEPGLLDDALRNKVILSSPITLYAILAIIRQAVDNFNLEQTAAEIIGLLGEFNKQWNLFKEGMVKMGKRIEDAQSEYHKLITTRSNQLERPLRKIEDIRSRSQLSLPGDTNEK